MKWPASTWFQRNKISGQKSTYNSTPMSRRKHNYCCENRSRLNYFDKLIHEPYGNEAPNCYSHSQEEKTDTMAYGEMKRERRRRKLGSHETQGHGRAGTAATPRKHRKTTVTVQNIVSGR